MYPMTVLSSRGVFLSVPCRITSSGVWKKRAALIAVSVAIYFERIVRHACKLSPIHAASSAIVWSIGGIETGMISEVIQLINNLCGEYPLVVCVATLGLLFGLLSTSSSSEL